MEHQTEENDSMSASALPESGATHQPDGHESMDHTEKKQHSRKTMVIIAVAAVVVLLAGAAAWYFLLHKKPVADQHAADVSNTTQTDANKVQSITDPLLAKFAKPATGETWLPERKKVDNLGYMANIDPQDIDYYEIGTHGSSVIYESDSHQGIGDALQLFEKDQNGAVRAITHPDANETYSATYDKQVKDGWFTADVAIDTTTHYDSLSLPNSFDIGKSETVAYTRNGTMYLGNPTLIPASDSVTRTTLQTFGGSKLVKIERKYADTHLTAINYVLDLPIGTELTLTYAPIGLNVSEYAWDNGVAIPKKAISADTLALNPNYLPDEMAIGGIVRGCGAYGALARADAVQDSDFVATGKTADGKTVYAFKDSNNTLVQKSYQEYQDFFKDDKTVQIVSLEEFVKQHAVIAYKSSNNGWLVYTRNNFAAIGGCAKPVVYLYPTTAQNVTVKVGAKVTVSDPLYNQVTGWTAFARPDGTLTVSGKSYGSLFWEGQGSGLYPGIASGTVVKRADAVSTIAKQLKQQGLNDKEAADFLAYWTPKIPNQPYIRLTWFNTEQMNQLAPLNITPRPDTLLRVFLDMSGYNYPVTLPAQQLQSTPRAGFTAVEWGGLSGTALQ